MNLDLGHKPASASGRFFWATGWQFLLKSFDRNVVMSTEHVLDRGVSTEMQKSQWQSSHRPDPMLDAPFTAFALFILLWICLGASGIVLGVAEGWIK